MSSRRLRRGRVGARRRALIRPAATKKRKKFNREGTKECTKNGLAESARLARPVVDPSLKVHRAIGPALLNCLARELRSRDRPVDVQVLFPIIHEGSTPDAGY
jgi:hypothetical protein